MPLIMMAIMLGNLRSGDQTLIAQTTGDRDQSDMAQWDDDTVEVIRLDQLHEPPPQLMTLIKQGNVRLVTGAKPSSTSSRDDLPGDLRLAGETRFHFGYRYDSRATWKIENQTSSVQPATTMVQIRVRFRSLKLFTSHDVWLLKPPPKDQFWDNAVVRHEFDHVRISSDPRIEDHFRGAVKKLEQFRVPLSEVRGDSGQIENALVQSLVESRMKEIMSTTTDLVRIRYQELDRQTMHGTRPLPTESELLDAPSLR